MWFPVILTSTSNAVQKFYLSRFCLVICWYSFTTLSVNESISIDSLICLWWDDISSMITKEYFDGMDVSLTYFVSKSFSLFSKVLVDNTIFKNCGLDRVLNILLFFWVKASSSRYFFPVSTSSESSKMVDGNVSIEWWMDTSSLFFSRSLKIFLWMNETYSHQVML